MTKLAALVSLAAVSCLFTIAQPARAEDKLVSPTEDKPVRGAVKFKVAQSAVPQNGFITIYVDNKFVGATAVVTTDYPPVFVYAWETKSDDPSTPSVKDGKHDLTITIHDTSGDVTDTITSTFTLGNKAPLSSPNDKVKVVYKFAPSATLVYKVNITSQALDQYGLATAGTAPVQGDYKIIQRVEDSQAYGTALLSYAVDRDGLCYILGQPNMINPGRVGSSVYKQVNIYGRVLQDNVLARKGRPSIPDVLVELPGQPIKIGDSWASQNGKALRIEGAGDIFTMSSQNTLEDLEWEEGQVCAKIKSTLSGVGRLLSTDKNAAPSQIKGEGVFYVAFKTGTLIKSIIILSASVDLSLKALGSISGPGAARRGAASSWNVFDEDEDYGQVRPSSSPSGSPSTPSGSAAQPPGGARIKIVTQL